jgi:CRP-like cAMP-binding protein
MYEPILANVARHINLVPAEVDYFVSLLTHQSISRKEFLLQAGEVLQHQTFVTKGCLRTYSISEEGKEHIIMFAPEGWWCGDLYSFLSETPATCYIDALEKTEVFQISKANQEKLYQHIPKFERFFRMLFQNAFILHQRRIASSLSDKAEERYEAFRKRYPKLEQRIAQKHIASYLGVTPEFFSTLRKK